MQEQPYLLVAQRRRVDELRREALKAGLSPEAASRIVPDQGGPRPGVEEPAESAKATVLTRLWKEYGEDGSVRAVNGDAGYAETGP